MIKRRDNGKNKFLEDLMKRAKRYLATGDNKCYVSHYEMLALKAAGALMRKTASYQKEDGSFTPVLFEAKFRSIQFVHACNEECAKLGGL